MSSGDPSRGMAWALAPLAVACPSCNAAPNVQCRERGEIRDVCHKSRQRMLRPDNSMHVACPECNAGAGTFCRDDDGRTRTPHRPRRKAILYNLASDARAKSDSGA